MTDINAMERLMGSLINALGEETWGGAMVKAQRLMKESARNKAKQETTLITDLRSFKNALDTLMDQAGNAGLSDEEIERTMVDYAQYAQMHTTGFPEHSTRHLYLCGHMRLETNSEDGLNQEIHRHACGDCGGNF